MPMLQLAKGKILSLWFFNRCNTMLHSKNPAVIPSCRGKSLDQIAASDYSEVDFRSIFFLLNFIRYIKSSDESKLLLILKQFQNSSH